MSLQPCRPEYPTIDAVLATMLERMRAHPAGAAVVESGRPWHRLSRGPKRSVTHGEMGRRITAVAAQLERRGIAEGDAVLYAVRPGADSMVLLSALLLAGANVIGLDPGLGAALLAERLKVLRPRWVIAESVIYAATASGPLRWWLRRQGTELPDIRLADATFVRVGPWLPGVPPSISFGALCVANDGATAEARSHRADRHVFAVFTSGTTSAPKAVLHTAASLGAACAIIGERMALSPSDVVYSTQTHQTLAAMMSGATCVVPPLQPDAHRFVHDVERFGVTHTYAVPFELAAVVARLEQRGGRFPEHLRTIILGSAPIRPAFLARLQAVCSPRTDIWCAYAMTEMFPVALVEAREKLAFAGVGDLVGAPIVDAHVELAPDGELLVAGPNLFARYVGHEAVALHATGDLARIDAEGRIVLLGRKKDMIIRGHHNIYPSLYEEAIATIEGVAACALVGVANKEGTDEHVVLAVEPKAGQDAGRLQKRVEQAMRDGSCAIDAFARPDLVVVCDMPHAGRSFKLDRRRLAEIAAAALADHGR